MIHLAEKTFPLKCLIFTSSNGPLEQESVYLVYIIIIFCVNFENLCLSHEL